MKNTPADQAVSDQVNKATADELRQFIERDEQLAAEASDVRDRRKENMTAAKSKGFCPKAIKVVVKARASDPDKFKHDRSVADFYLELIGL